MSEQIRITVDLDEAICALKGLSKVEGGNCNQISKLWATGRGNGTF
jgi:hypothetical protein